MPHNVVDDGLSLALRATILCELSLSLRGGLGIVPGLCWNQHATCLRAPHGGQAGAVGRHDADQQWGRRGRVREAQVVLSVEGRGHT